MTTSCPHITREDKIISNLIFMGLFISVLSFPKLWVNIHKTLCFFCCFTPSFCLFAVILPLFPKHSFFIPPAPHIRWTMQFDAEIAVSDNILHKMTQFKRRLWRGKFGPRFLIDFFVKFGLARKSLNFVSNGRCVLDMTFQKTELSLNSTKPMH